MYASLRLRHPPALLQKLHEQLVFADQFLTHVPAEHPAVPDQSQGRRLARHRLIKYTGNRWISYTEVVSTRAICYRSALARDQDAQKNETDGNALAQTWRLPRPNIACQHIGDLYNESL
jgi:hypothetical protein